MEQETLEIIKELMEQLQSEMKPGAEDFEERLGRKKPGVEVIKVEGKLPMDDDMHGDGESMLADMGMEDEMDPKEKLKRRLMKLRA